MSAIILQHSSSTVTFDLVPPDPREQTVIQPSYTPPTEGEWARLEGCEAVGRLVAEHGVEQVARWVRFQAYLLGVALQNDERPAHLCLADGAVLNNGTCVQCGRDNS